MRIKGAGVGQACPLKLKIEKKYASIMKICVICVPFLFPQIFIFFITQLTYDYEQ